jgi:predicted amino acid-binding ACT domain protein
MLTIKKTDVWSATLEDRPGSIKEKLEGLVKVGADLGFLIARRTHREPGKGVLFVAPIVGERQVQAAIQTGFKTCQNLHCLQVTGADEPGLAYRITSAIAQEGVNLRGLSAASLRGEFTMFLAFDAEADSNRVADRLHKIM